MSAPRQNVLGRQIFCIEEAGFCVDFTSIYWAYGSVVDHITRHDASSLIDWLRNR
jgi:hypothetical protein